jgi:hypothetical protein
MLESRGSELLGRPSAATGERVRAAILLERAARIHEEVGSRRAQETRRTADETKQGVVKSYRAAAASLGRALSGRGPRRVDPAVLERRAREVAAFLEQCDGPAIRWLRRLSGAQREGRAR